MKHTARIPTAITCSLLVAALAGGVSACGGADLSGKPFDAEKQISFNGAPDGHKQNPYKPLQLTAKSGRITDVTASDAHGHQVPGKLSRDGSHWQSTAALDTHSHYTLRVRTENGDGAPGQTVYTFDTGTLGKHHKLLKATFSPKPGTYGVGQPLVAKLSLPVRGKKARAAVERALQVRSRPAVTGSWYWVDSKTLHYRPRHYWPIHAKIQVHSGLNSVHVGGLWGASSKPLHLTTGDDVEAVTDAGTHQMIFYRNGKKIRQFPITTGKPGYETRNGIKVVLEKQAYVRMRSASVGIADFYDLPVYWDTRVTWSGEYVHAAPWSVGSQGYANVSHGCTGASMANAKWFFEHVRRGDIVKVINSNGDMMTPFDNGFGDWNLSWSKWLQGSALHGKGRNDETGGRVQAARLRPKV